MLSAQDIQNQQFHVRFRGFDVEEVDEFLEQAASTVQALSQEVQDLRERVEEAERKAASYKRQEKSAMGAILSAQNVAQEMKEKAREEARQVLAEAKKEALALEESAGQEVSLLEREVDRLKGMKSKIREEVRQLLQNYLTSLDREPEPLTNSSSSTVSRFTPPSAHPDASPAAALTDQPEDQAGEIISEADGLYQRIELDDKPSTGKKARDSSPAEEEELSPLAGRGYDGDTEDDLSGSGVMASPGLTPVKEQAKEDESALPDLDGDMVFTLEDPLDEVDDEADREVENENEPVIKLDPEREEDEKPSKER